MEEKCVVSAIVNRMEGDLKEVRQDVKKLLAFKWQVVGGSIISSTIFSSVVAVGITLFSQK